MPLPSLNRSKSLLDGPGRKGSRLGRGREAEKNTEVCQPVPPISSDCLLSPGCRATPVLLPDQHACGRVPQDRRRGRVAQRAGVGASAAAEPQRDQQASGAPALACHQGAYPGMCVGTCHSAATRGVQITAGSFLALQCVGSAIQRSNASNNVNSFAVASVGTLWFP